VALLELEGVDAFYGRIQALRGVSIKVDRGEIVALARPRRCVLSRA